MSDFEDRSGRVIQSTAWGSWSQTVADISVEVELEQGTKGKEVQVDIAPRTIRCLVRGLVLFQGDFCQPVLADESTWTVEDRKLLRILLVKSGGGQVEFWPSLLVGQYAPDPLTLLRMRKKLDLERYQVENPGFDFSDAVLDKQYEEFPLEMNSRVDLSEFGAAAPDDSSVNRTDDEKLEEARLVPNMEERTDDMKNADNEGHETTETDEEKSGEDQDQLNC